MYIANYQCGCFYPAELTKAICEIPSYNTSSKNIMRFIYYYLEGRVKARNVCVEAELFGNPTHAESFWMVCKNGDTFTFSDS